MSPAGPTSAAISPVRAPLINALPIRLSLFGRACFTALNASGGRLVRNAMRMAPTPFSALPASISRLAATCRTRSMGGLRYVVRRYDATLYEAAIASTVQRSVLPSYNAYCPTVKSNRFSTAPDASRTSTCHAPVQSAGTVFLLHVRQGDPPTCSSTSPTWVSPWNHTWWMLPPPAPVTLVQQMSWPTSAGNALPVSCGARSRTDLAIAASSTVIWVAGATAGAGDGAGAAVFEVS